MIGKKVKHFATLAVCFQSFDVRRFLPGRREVQISWSSGQQVTPAKKRLPTVTVANILQSGNSQLFFQRFGKQNTFRHLSDGFCVFYRIYCFHFLTVLKGGTNLLTFPDAEYLSNRLPGFRNYGS